MVLSVYVDTHEPSGHGGELAMRVVPFRFDVPGTNWKPFGPVLLAEGESVAVGLVEPTDAGSPE